MPPLTTLISQLAEDDQDAGKRVAALLQKIFKDVPEEYQPEILEEREIRLGMRLQPGADRECAADHWPQGSDGDHRRRRTGGVAVSVLL